MILVDFSSIIHRMIHTSIANAKPAKKDGQYVTSDFVGLTKYYILQDLFSINTEHRTNFGDVVICLDKSSDGYWRKDFYPGYKSRRKAGRDESDINYQEVFDEVNDLIENIEQHIPWKVLSVPKAEADDIILVLAKEFCDSDKILIHSPDKDMLQAQRDNDTVFQYSALTKKWLVPENKHDHMDHWILEHVCLGDASDDVPKVVDHTEFSDAFKEHLKQNGYNIECPVQFKKSDIPNDEKRRLLTSFKIFKTNRKGESTGELDIYKSMRFGASNLQKVIKQHGSLGDWLDSHPLYRQHYERNFTLVMEEGIPQHIRDAIIEDFKTAKVDYNPKQFEDYLINNNLRTILMEMPNHFKLTRDLTADDFGWD